MRKKHNFMLKRNLLMQVCNWKLKKKSMNCLRMTVCEGRVPYGPFMIALFYVLPDVAC